jgi:hypothetical protein
MSTRRRTGGTVSASRSGKGEGDVTVRAATVEGHQTDQRSFIRLARRLVTELVRRAPGTCLPQVAGPALICPLLPGLRDIPEHRVVAGSGEIGDDDFRRYFVIQTPEVLERYERHVAPAARSSTRQCSSGSANGGHPPPIKRRLTRVRQ